MSLPNANKMVRLRDKCQCQICGYSSERKLNIADDSNLNVDHIFPKSLFAFSHPYNLQVLCIDCNFDKFNFVDEIQPIMFKNAFSRSNNLWSEKKIDTIYQSLNGYYQDDYLNYQHWDQLGKTINEKFITKIFEFNKKEENIILSEFLDRLITVKNTPLGPINKYNNKRKDYFWRVFDSMLYDDMLDLIKGLVFPK